MGGGGGGAKLMYMTFVKSWFINCKCILMVHGGVSDCILEFDL